MGPCGGAAALLGRTLLEVCKLDKLACDPIAVGIEVDKAPASDAKEWRKGAGGVWFGGLSPV